MHEIKNLDALELSECQRRAVFDRIAGWKLTQSPVSNETVTNFVFDEKLSSFLARIK